MATECVSCCEKLGTENKLLPCLHVLCLLCAADIATHEPNQQTLCCPLCQSQTDCTLIQLPSAFVVSEEKQPICECVQPATVWCIAPCNAPACPLCEYKHVCHLHTKAIDETIAVMTSSLTMAADFVRERLSSLKLFLKNIDDARAAIERQSAEIITLLENVPHERQVLCELVNAKYKALDSQRSQLETHHQFAQLAVDFVTTIKPAVSSTKSYRIVQQRLQNLQTSLPSWSFPSAQPDFMIDEHGHVRTIAPCGRLTRAYGLGIRWCVVGKESKFYLRVIAGDGGRCIDALKHTVVHLFIADSHVDAERPRSASLGPRHQQLETKLDLQDNDSIVVTYTAPMLPKHYELHVFVNGELVEMTPFSVNCVNIPRYTQPMRQEQVWDSPTPHSGRDMAVLPDHSIAVCDQLLARIFFLSSDGAILRSIGESAILRFPQSISYDPVEDAIWVADWGNSRICAISRAHGDVIREGPCSTPVGLTVAPQSRLVAVSMWNNHVVDVFDINTATVVRTIGMLGSRPGLFRFPAGIDLVIDSDTGKEMIVVCDSRAERLQIFDVNTGDLDGTINGLPRPMMVRATMDGYFLVLLDAECIGVYTRAGECLQQWRPTDLKALVGVGILSDMRVCVLQDGPLRMVIL